jgi:2-phospho-L-lactate guanylyltransferase
VAEGLCDRLARVGLAGELKFIHKISMERRRGKTGDETQFRISPLTICDYDARAAGDFRLGTQLKIIAVIPLKPAAECKQRLAPVFSRPRRLELVQAMLDNVLHALDSASSVAETKLLTNDRSHLAPGIERIADPGGGINAALNAAAAIVTAQGADAMLILPADLPWITGRDIDELLQLARPGTAIVVPDKHFLGSNALLLAPPTLLLPRFGARSLAAHSRAAAAAGVPLRIHRCPNIARDIDQPCDVVAWPGPGATDLPRSLAAAGE